ncbi:MAG: SPOR domain-containing protein [Pseudomonadota bacterium]
MRREITGKGQIKMTQALPMQPCARGSKPLVFAACLTALFLGGCDEGFQLGGDRPDEVSLDARSTTLVERDVEAPEVFQVSEAGLWDGRPSLGGVWVAHPDVTEPERVIIRNESNGKFVIGALFKRERDIPGPRLQVSSDAANTLAMLAGAPVELNVTALRREPVTPEPEPETLAEDAEALAADGPVTDTPLPEAAETAAVAAATAGLAIAESDASEAPTVTTASAKPVTAAALDPVTSATASALRYAPDLAIVSAAAAAVVPPKPVDPEPATVAPQATRLSKPYIQIGIFSVEDNANRTAQQMRNSGMVPTVLAQQANGKPFWRVVVGPAQTKSERSAILKQIKTVGFTDAYPVTN